MLELGIDQLTAVLQMTDEQSDRIDGIKDWPPIAEEMIHSFVDNADLEKILGKRKILDIAPHAYNKAYSFGEHSFYFAVAYNASMPNMGVIIKFSAQALEYCLKANQMKVYEFLQSVCDEDSYLIRLSQVDCDADYFDEDFRITKIYEDLMMDNIGIITKRVFHGKEIEINRKSKIQGFVVGHQIGTLYINSVQTSAQLRIYEKRDQQIKLKRKATHLKKALNHSSWIRFEVVFRSDLAHQIGAYLIGDVSSDKEFYDLIASSILQKFTFKNIENGQIKDYTTYTEQLVNSMSGNVYKLFTPRGRDNNLAERIRYLLEGSGTVSTLQKVNAIWGDKAVHALSKKIVEYALSSIPNTDCLRWNTKNVLDYQKEYPSYSNFESDLNDLGII